VNWPINSDSIDRVQSFAGQQFSGAMVPNTSIRPLFSPHAVIGRRTSTVAFAVSSTATQIGGFLSKKPYVPPSWASELSLTPSHSFTLGQVSFAIFNTGSLLF
jgi:hypothetical protein